MTPRQIVRLLRLFDAAADQQQLRLSDLLPLPGCDPGPTGKMFPKLFRGPHARSAVIKTGTLSTTDGGVAVLAGRFDSPTRGAVYFCAAAPRAGKNLRLWRHREENWLLELQKSAGGATEFPCGKALPMSDSFARIEIQGVPTARETGAPVSLAVTVDR